LHWPTRKIAQHLFHCHVGMPATTAQMQHPRIVPPIIDGRASLSAFIAGANTGLG
jgi:hypothetical protein